MRQWIIMITGLMLACPLQAGPPGGNPRSPSKPSQARKDAGRSRLERRRQRTINMVRALSRPVDKVAFDEEPFEDVLDWFKKQGLRNIVISWKRLDREGLAERDTPVTLVLEGLSLGEVLDLVLEQVSSAAASDEQRLTYHIFDGILRISTRGDFANRVYTRTYYVEDLLYPFTLNEMMPYLAIGAQIPIAGVTDIAIAGGGGGGGLGGGGGGGLGGGGIGGGGGGVGAGGGAIEIIDQGITFGPGESTDARPDFEGMREDTLEALVELIKTIREDSWRENGGKGTISAFSDKLIITQTIEMHEIIGGTFEQISKVQEQGRKR